MAQGLAVKGIIRPAVLIFFLEAAADFNATFRGNGDIAPVEETMEIAPQKEAVVHHVCPALVERPDMGGFERRQGMLFSYRTGAVISIRYEDSERPLTKAWPNCGFLAIACLFLCDVVGFFSQVEYAMTLPSHLQIPPDELAGFFIKLIALGLAANDRGAPIRGGKSHRFVEEERLGQDDATDLEIFLGIVGNSSVMDEPLAHLGIGGGPVFLLECLPGQAYGEDRKGGKDSSPGDQVLIMCPLAAMELEEEYVPFPERAKLCVR